MTWLLPRIVGLGRAMYLTLSADPIDAEEAAAIGLVDRVTQAETVLDEAKDFARRIASYPRTGVEWTKIGYMRALESDFDDGDAERGGRRARVLPVAGNAGAISGVHRTPARVVAPTRRAPLTTSARYCR